MPIPSQRKYIISERGADAIQLTIETFLRQLSKSSITPASILSQPFTRMHSWDDCYLFFQAHLPGYIASPSGNKGFLDEATLHLAFYLASFGMFRGTLPYLQYSKDIFRQPLLETFDLMRSEKWVLPSVLSNPKALFRLQTRFKESLTASLHTAGYTETSQPSSLLLQKVFLGIFAASPALDRFCAKGLKNLKEIENAPKEIKELSNPFASEESLRNWYLFAENLAANELFKALKPSSISDQAYPIMRKIDLILWSIGKSHVESDKHKKRKRQK